MPNNIPLKVRASNPFKKKKQETKSDQIGSNTAEVSIASEVEILDTLCASTSNISSIVIADSPRKRKNDIHLDQLDDIESESSQEQVSVVTSTQIATSGIVTSESQESVNSKLSKQKRMVKNDKLKRNSCSTNKKGSILNFFSPV